MSPRETAPALPVRAPGRSEDDGGASNSPLLLYLTSVSPGRNRFEGGAQLGINVDNPQSFSAGAILGNGARLVEIHSDHVVLQRGDRSVRLDLHDSNRLQTRSAQDELLTLGGTAAAPVAAPALTREILTDYLRPSPVYDGDVLRGFQIYPGARRAVFAQLGLQVGDLITAVDGMPLSDPDATMQMLRELISGAALHVTLQSSQGFRQVRLDGALIVADQQQAAAPAFVDPAHPM